MDFYEETNPPDISLSEVMRLLRTCFPNIRGHEVKFHYHGSYNVFEVKGEYMFRFPDKVFFGEKGFDLIQREQKLLELIREHISLRIPKPIYVSSDPKNPFVGYEKIGGISLSRCFDRTNMEDQKNITKQLGRFLTELHSRKVYQNICTTWKNEQDINPSQYQCDWQNYFEKAKEMAYPLLTSNQKQWTSKIFLDFLGEKKNFEFTPTVVHNDFDTSNVLVDPTTFEVTGIIDFEETGVYDPAADFIFYNEGEFFLNQLFTNYRGVKDRNIKNRMKFLYCRAGLIYILTGVEYNITKMVEYGLHLINRRMKRFPK